MKGGIVWGGESCVWEGSSHTCSSSKQAEGEGQQTGIPTRSGSERVNDGDEGTTKAMLDCR